MPSKLMGVDAGGTNISFGISDVHGKLQDQWSIKTNILDNGNHIVPDMIDSISHRLSLYNLKPSDFYAIGMDFPGNVVKSGSAVSGAYNLNWGPAHDVKGPLEDKFKIPVVLENDANVAALGENWKGAGNSSQDVITVMLGTGIGAGIIENGKLQLGFHGSAGEIGHICVVPNGFKCACGKQGCLERYASANGIVELANHLAEQYEGTSKLKKLLDTGQDVTSETIVNLAKKNDYLALKSITQSCKYIGLVLSYVGNILDPETIVIGGGVSQAGQFLVNLIEKPFNELLFPPLKGKIKLKLAKLGNIVGLFGALSLALKYVEDKELNKRDLLAKKITL